MIGKGAGRITHISWRSIGSSIFGIQVYAFGLRILICFLVLSRGFVLFLFSQTPIFILKVVIEFTVDVSLEYSKRIRGRPYMAKKEPPKRPKVNIV